MQATLLTLGISLILALVAALVAPHFIDWRDHRSFFEAQLKGLSGFEVAVDGPIDAVLLPEPRVVLRHVGLAPHPGNGTARIRIDEVRVALSLGPLLRGQFQASEVVLTRPVATVELDRAGVLQWPAPVARAGGEGEAGRIEVRAGRIEVFRADEPELVLAELNATGELLSLEGPLRAEGGFMLGGVRHGFRLATGRGLEAGALRVRLGLEPANRPMTLDVEARVTVVAGRARATGTLTAARPSLRTGDEPPRLATDPLRLEVRFAADADRVVADKVEAVAGPDDRAVRLSGTGEMVRQPQGRSRLALTLAARQVDLDRAIGGAAAPAAVAAALLEAFPVLAAPPVESTVSLAVEALVMGGQLVQGVRADIATVPEGFRLERLEARLPGGTTLRARGLVAADHGAARFTGPAVIDMREPRGLADWLEGRALAARTGPPAGGAPAPRALMPVKLAGTFDWRSRRIGIDGLEAEIDGARIGGRIVYAHQAGGAVAEAELTADRLDLDLIGTLAQGLGFTDPALRPVRLDLALVAQSAVVAGVEARGIEARLALDRAAVIIRKLALADLGGAAVTAVGRIEGLAATPVGTLEASLTGSDLAGLARILETALPATPLVQQLVAVLPRLKPARLTGRVQAGTPGFEVTVEGDAAGGRLALRGTLPAATGGRQAAALALSGSLTAPDSEALWRVLGVARPGVAPGPAELTATLGGRAGEPAALRGSITAPGLRANLDGRFTLDAEGRPSGSGTFEAVLADGAGPLAALTGLQARAIGVLPVDGRVQLRLSGGVADVVSERLDVAGQPVQLRLTLDRNVPRLTGEIGVERLDLAAVLAAATGTAAPLDRGWPQVPFQAARTGPEVLVSLKARAFSVVRALRADLGGEALAATLRAEAGAVSLEGVTARLAGGEVTARLRLVPQDLGIGFEADLGLTDVDAARLVMFEARSPIGGRLSGTLSLRGLGRSAATLIGGLEGGGTLTLTGASLAALDARAFDAVVRAVDAGMPIDDQRIAGVFAAAFDAGRLALPRLETSFALAGGVARTGNIALASPDVAGQVSASLDLAQGTLDARLTLRAPRLAAAAGGSPPEVSAVLRGPLAAPRRTLDTAPLVGWLTVRRFEAEVKRLEALEADRRAREAGEPRPLTLPPAGATVPGGPAPAVAPPVRPRLPTAPLVLPPGPPASTAPPPGSSGLLTPRRPLEPAGSSAAANPLPPRPALALPPLPPPIDVRPAPGR